MGVSPSVCRWVLMDLARRVSLQPGARIGAGGFQPIARGLGLVSPETPDEYTAIAAQPAYHNLSITSTEHLAILSVTTADAPMNSLVTRPPNRGGNRDAQISKRAGSRHGGPHRTEWLLVAEHEPPLGSHVVTPRRGYLHHGIYVGDGTVVHYAGRAHGLRRGPVEEVPLARFTHGQPVWRRSSGPADFDHRDVTRRARSRAGEDRGGSDCVAIACRCERALTSARRIRPTNAGRAPD